jgi:hypothetical protein
VAAAVGHDTSIGAEERPVGHALHMFREMRGSLRRYTSGELTPYLVLFVKQNDKHYYGSRLKVGNPGKGQTIPEDKYRRGAVLK